MSVVNAVVVILWGIIPIPIRHFALFHVSDFEAINDGLHVIADTSIFMDS